MQSIVMSNGQVYATNRSGVGVFVRERYEGAYRQLVGNAQTPRFHNPVQFRSWLRRHLAVRGCRIVEYRGWRSDE